MPRRYGKAATLAVVLAAFMVGGISSAAADTLSYEKNDTIWLANPDGTQARSVTPAGAAFGWPSESDSGTVVALGPGTSTSGNPVLFGDLYVMDAMGSVNHRITTPADVETCSSLSALYVRISPDGSRIAYYERTCATDGTWWTPTSSTSINYPGQTLGQEQQRAPAWIDNTHLLLSGVAEPFSSDQQEFNVYTVGNGDNSYAPWFSDTDGGIRSGGWAYGFNATISRQGDKIAVIETDGKLTPRRVELHLFTTTGPPPAPPAFTCATTLEPATSAGSYIGTSPTFSPDGMQLAFAEPDGVHVANVSNLSNCSSLTAPLVIADASQPFWSPAALPQAAANSPVLSTLKINPSVLHKGRGKLTVSYQDSVAGKTAGTVKQLEPGVKHGSRCVASRGKPKGAKTCTRYVTVGSFSHSDKAGTNRFTLPTRVTKALKRGRFKLALVEKASGKKSNTISGSFKVR